MNADGVIDFKKLEKDLFAAVEEDARYQRENDAKFRAIEQKVGSYEEFKDIVAASHLRPLDKKDREGLYTRKQPWNPYADRLSGKTSQTINNSASEDVKIPKNCHEFLQQWRRCGHDKSEKYHYLMKIGGLKLCEIFKTEIAMGLLGEIIDILFENWNAVDSHSIYQILDKLSTVKRFSLSLQFLGNHEKEVLSKLLNKLEITQNNMKGELDSKVNINEKSIAMLKDIYGVRS